jgi:hypothetical protein
MNAWWTCRNSMIHVWPVTHQVSTSRLETAYKRISTWNDFDGWFCGVSNFTRHEHGLTRATPF